MRKLIKTVSVILVMSFLLSSCGASSTEKAVAQIKEYFEANKYNECLEYTNKLEIDTKTQINDTVLFLISDEYNELIAENKINTNDIYALDAIDNSFAEKCRKLWNIAKTFSIGKDNENHSDFVYLHYYAEMCNYTKYGEIYSLLKKVHNSGYLNEITNALHAYENDGNSLAFDGAYKFALMFEHSSFNPQEYLVDDYKNAHNHAVKALKSLNNGFTTSDVNVIASSMNDLKDALSEILYISDTLNTIHSKQSYIFNELLNGELNTVFNTDLEFSQREYEVGITLSLDNIFGQSTNDETGNEIDDNSDAVEKISKSRALEIAVNAINKTKSYKDKLNVGYTQTINLQMTEFDDKSTISNTSAITKSAIEKSLENANGTKKKDIIFNKGTNGTISLNGFIPPSDKKAIGNADSIKEYNVVNGSGGYIITITFLPEATSKNSTVNGISSIINGFSFENSENIKDYKSTYSKATAVITVNNNGLLEKMEYEISGISDCNFVDNNGTFLFEAQFSFNEKYVYSFKY